MWLDHRAARPRRRDQMNERISAGSAYLVELCLAAGAAGEVLTAASVTHLGRELVGVRAATEGAVRDHSPVAMGWT